MRHDWIFAVLKDLRAYAALNGLSATVAKVDEALRTAQAEVAMAREPPPRPMDSPPPMAKRPN